MLVECDCGASCDAVENDPGCLKETRWREKLKGVATVRMQGDVKLTRLVRFVNLFIQRFGLEALFDFVSFPLLKLGLKSAVTHTRLPPFSSRAITQKKSSQNFAGSRQRGMLASTFC